MKTILLSTLCIFLFSSVFAQPIPKDSLYLGQTPPGTTPKIFKLPADPGFISQDRIAITSDGKNIFYFESNGLNTKLKYFTYNNNKWNGPFNLFDGYWGVGLSINGDTLFLQKGDYSGINPLYAYYSVKNETGWDNPNRILTNLNYAHYLQVTNNGHYYIAARPSIATIGDADWSKLTINGNDTAVVSLGLPLNNTGLAGDFCVSKDDSFIIISRNGQMISFHNKDDSWTTPQNLGSKINFSSGSWGTYISSDNKYLFYTTYTTGPSDTYIYWVRIDGLTDNLRPTSVSIKQTFGQNIQVYPHQTKDKINITFGTLQYKIAIIEITNINGEQILSNTFYNEPTVIIDLSSKPKGIYLISINIDGEILNKKICLE